MILLDKKFKCIATITFTCQLPTTNSAYSDVRCRGNNPPRIIDKELSYRYIIII